MMDQAVMRCSCSWRRKSRCQSAVTLVFVLEDCCDECVQWTQSKSNLSDVKSRIVKAGAVTSTITWPVHTHDTTLWNATSCTLDGCQLANSEDSRRSNCSVFPFTQALWQRQQMMALGLLVLSVCSVKINLLFNFGSYINLMLPFLPPFWHLKQVWERVTRVCSRLTH